MLPCNVDDVCEIQYEQQWSEYRSLRYATHKILWPEWLPVKPTEGCGAPCLCPVRAMYELLQTKATYATNDQPSTKMQPIATRVLVCLDTAVCLRRRRRLALLNGQYPLSRGLSHVWDDRGTKGGK